MGVTNKDAFQATHRKKCAVEATKNGTLGAYDGKTGDFIGIATPAPFTLSAPKAMSSAERLLMLMFGAGMSAPFAPKTNLATSSAGRRPLMPKFGSATPSSTSPTRSNMTLSGRRPRISRASKPATSAMEGFTEGFTGRVLNYQHAEEYTGKKA